MSACANCGHDESVHGKRRKRRCDMWDFGTVRCECSGFVAVGGETAAPSERGENVLPGSNPGGGKPDIRNGALLEPRSLDAAVERLTAWANDFGFSARFERPHYRNPGEIRADVKVLLAAVGAESGASTARDKLAAAFLLYDSVLKQAQVDLVKGTDSDFFWEDRVRDFVEVVRHLRKRHRRLLAFVRTAVPSPDSDPEGGVR